MQNQIPTFPEGVTGFHISGLLSATSIKLKGLGRCSVSVLVTTRLNFDFVFMPPTSEEVEGAYWFRSVRAVSQSVSTRSGTVRARILKFGM